VNADYVYHYIKQLEQEKAELTQQLAEAQAQPSIPPEVEYFISLVAPHVERNEAMYDLLPENRAEIVRAYRKVRPKGA